MAPVRLHKQEEKTFDDKLEDVMLQYAHIIVPLCVFLAIVLVIVLVITIAQNATAVPVCVESGDYYNHLKDVI